ncbi:hypothetical protein CBL_01511 [Carabus blaptoides fortunei]
MEEVRTENELPFTNNMRWGKAGIEFPLRRKIRRPPHRDDFTCDPEAEEQFDYHSRSTAQSTKCMTTCDHLYSISIQSLCWREFLLCKHHCINTTDLFTHAQCGLFISSSCIPGWPNKDGSTEIVDGCIDMVQR